jgi:hypothetical protein
MGRCIKYLLVTSVKAESVAANLLAKIQMLCRVDLQKEKTFPEKV